MSEQPPLAHPPARWKIERVSDSQLDLLISTDPACWPQRFPMNGDEAWAFIRGLDRVQAWAAPSAEGTFTQPFATPDQVREQLSINGYIVASPDIAAHTKLVQATPWANWVEEVPAPVGYQVAWFVNVFAPDDAQFLQLAQTHCVRLEPSVYSGPPEDDGEPAAAGPEGQER